MHSPHRKAFDDTRSVVKNSLHCKASDWNSDVMLPNVCRKPFHELRKHEQRLACNSIRNTVINGFIWQISVSGPLVDTALPEPPEPCLPEPLSFWPSGRQSRKPRQFQDKLPVPPTPILPSPPTIVRRVILHVNDFFRSDVNQFGILREYTHRPSYDPDSHLKLDDLANYPPDPVADRPNLNPTNQPPPWPFSNMSKYLLMNWFHTGGSVKSESEITRLAQEVISAPGFKPDHLAGFNANRENKTLDDAHTTPSGSTPFLDDDWREVSVEIDIPVPLKGSAPRQFQVPGLHY